MDNKYYIINDKKGKLSFPENCTPNLCILDFNYPKTIPLPLYLFNTSSDEDLKNKENKEYDIFEKKYPDFADLSLKEDRSNEENNRLYEARKEKSEIHERLEILRNEKMWKNVGAYRRNYIDKKFSEFPTLNPFRIPQNVDPVLWEEGVVRNLASSFFLDEYKINEIKSMVRKCYGSYKERGSLFRLYDFSARIDNKEYSDKFNKTMEPGGFSLDSIFGDNQFILIKMSQLKLSYRTFFKKMLIDYANGIFGNKKINLEWINSYQEAP